MVTASGCIVVLYFQNNKHSSTSVIITIHTLIVYHYLLKVTLFVLLYVISCICTPLPETWQAGGDELEPLRVP